MPKILNNPRDNSLTLSGLVDLHAFWLDQPVTSGASPNFNNVTVDNDVTIGGDVIISGTTTIIGTDVLTIKDNIIEINSEETGVGVSSNLSGIQINRGTLSSYQFVFQETTDTFRIGETGTLQAVATREDTPLVNGVMIFNSIQQRLDSVNDIPISITLSSSEIASSSSTGALRVSGGVGVSGDVYMDGQLYIKGTSYVNFLDSNSSEEFILNTGSNFLLNVPASNYIKVPSDVLMAFGGNSNNISSNGANLTLATNGSLILQAGLNQPVNLRTNSPLTFGVLTEKITYDGANMVLDSNSTFLINADTSYTDTTTSTSPSIGSVKLAGGLSISNTTDATSSTNGGTITTAGGIAIAKQIITGGKASFEDVDEIESISTLGGASIKKKIILGSDYSSDPSASDAVFLQVPSFTFTDNTTSGSGTINDVKFNSYGIPTLSAVNTSITTTNASTVYIEGAPIGGTNQTITNSYSLFIDSGVSRLDGDLQVKSTTYSSDPSVGAVVVEGGVSIKQNLTVNKKLDVTSFINTSPSSDGVFISLSPSTVNDSTSVGTASEMLFNVIAQPTLSSTNIITTNNSATFVLDGPPLEGSNQTITNPYTFWVKNGVVKISDTQSSSSSTTGSIRTDGGIGVANTVDASSSSSGGAMTVAGGVGIGKKLYVAGQTILENSTESTNSFTGSLTTLGGVGILKDLNIGKKTSTGLDDFSTAPGAGMILSTGGNEITDNSTSASGTVAFISFNDFKQSTFSATNTDITTTDAATVYIEGAPIGGTNQTITNSYSLLVESGKSRFDDQLVINDTTTSTTPSTGAIVVSGGVGVSDNVNISGALDVNGLTTLDQTTVNTGDGQFSVSGANGANINVAASSSFSNTAGNITIDSEAGTLILDGNNSMTLDSTGGISIDAGTSSNLNVASGTLTVGGPVVNISSTNSTTITGGTSGGLTLTTADNSNGVKIGVANSVPITIGNSISETVIGDNLTVVGNLTVNGTAATINSTLVTVNDNAIVVNSLPGGISDGGLLVRRYQIPNNTSLGQVVLDTPFETSTFQTGSFTPGTLILNSAASAVNDFYKGWWVKITSGGANNRVRRIKTYDGATKTAVIYISSENTSEFVDGLDLDVAPSNGDSYNLYPGTYGGMFYDDTNDEWAIGKVPFDSSAGVFPLQGYNDLHCNSLIVEGGIDFGGDSLFDGTLTLDADSSQIFLIRKDGDAGDVFYVDTITPSVYVSNPVDTVSSSIPINFRGLNSSSTEVSYSQIKSVIESNIVGSFSGSLELNVSRLSSLENYITLDGNTQTVDFSTNVASVLFNNTATSTSNSSGSLRILGGIGISNTTDASSSTNGGTFTTAGGLAIAKKLYIGGGIYLDNVTSNFIVYGDGVNQPTQTTRSVGTKLVLNSGVSASSLDYGIGVESQNMWFSVPNGSGGDGFKWYTGNTVSNIMSLSLSQLNLNISTEANSSTTGAFITAGGAGIAKKLYVGTDLSVGGNVTSGAWNGTVISAEYGGTGQSSLTSNAVLLGNGTSPIQHPSNLTFSSNTLITPNLTSSDTTDATSSSSAPVIFLGGLGVAKKAYFGTSVDVTGNLSASDITLSGNSTIRLDTTDASDNGSISLSGGGSNLDTRGAFIKVDGNETATGGAISITAGNNNSSGYVKLTTANTERVSFNYDGTTDFKSTVDSSSSNSGALKIAGGVGIAKKLYIGTDLHVLGNSNLGVVSSGAWNATVITVQYGGTGATTLNTNSILLGNGTSTIQSPTTITYSSNTLSLPKIASTDTTQSTSSSTGAVTLLGGAGIAKNVYLGEGLFVSGNIGVGTSTNVNSAITLDAGSNIGINTVVTSDDGKLSISGSGVGSSARGALITLSGNEETDTGLLSLNAGNVSGGEIKLFTQNTSRFSIDYSGKTSFFSTTASTSNSTGAIVSSGGLGITNTTNATSSTNGGSITTAGGIAVAQDVYIGGNLYVSGSVPGSLVVTSPMSGTFNLVNVTSSVSANTKLLTGDAGERLFSGVFLASPSAANSTCSFEFTLPGVVTNFVNSYDITGSIQGNHDSTNFYSVENVVFYAVVGGTRAKVKFTSGSTDQHILQFNLRYTIV